MITRITQLLCLILLIPVAFAVTPVFDSINLEESVKQTAYQLKLYKTQLEEYKALIKNMASLTSFHWDEASLTINNLLQTIDSLKAYKNEAGSLAGYLEHYQTEDYYRQLLAVQGGFNPSQLDVLSANQRAASSAQKKANDALILGLDRQQDNLERDARELSILQHQAERAEGQKQALDAASQLASAELNQLLQIRALLIAEHNTEATRAQALMNREAIEAAGDARFRSGHFRKSTSERW